MQLTQNPDTHTLNLEVGLKNLPTKGDIVNSAEESALQLAVTANHEGLLVFAKVLSEYASAFEAKVRGLIDPETIVLTTGKVTRAVVQPSITVRGDKELERMESELAVASDANKMLKKALDDRRNALVSAHEVGLPLPEGVTVEVPEPTTQLRVKL